MPTMSLKEARKILGKEMSDKLSDEELQQLIWNLEALAREIIRTAVHKPTKVTDQND